jgi:hypothetical protein
MQSISVPPGESAEVECIQAERRVFTTTVSNPSKFMTRLLDPDTSDKVSSFEVYITEFNDVRRKWQLATLFRNTSKNSYAYVEFYTPSEQLGIRFGNGILGRIPSLGAVIEIECILTAGASDIPAGMPLIAISDPGLNSIFRITTGSTLEVGSEREDIESIRQNTLYYPSYDESLQWSNDHETFIRRNMPLLTWVSVWGESTQELLAGYKSIEFINKIYIAVHQPGISQSVLMEQINALYKNVDDYNVTFVPVETLFQSYTVRLRGKILGTDIPELIKAEIKKALAVYDKTSPSYIGTVKPNQIWNTVDDSGLLTSFELSIDGDSLMEHPPVNTMRYLDVAASDIDVNY